MKKSKAEAFTYMFKDGDWKYKLFILSALAFPSTFLSYQSDKLAATIKTLMASTENIYPIVGFFLLLLIFVIACTFLFEGYCCRCTQKIIYSNENSQEDLLPKWENEFWKYSKIGVSSSIGVGLLSMVAALGSILVVPLLFYIVGYVALKTLFCIDFKMSSFFAWKKALKLMKSNFGHYISVTLSALGVYIIFGFIAYFCTKSFILVFVAAFAQAYAYLAIAYLRGTLFTVTPEELFLAD